MLNVADFNGAIYVLKVEYADKCFLPLYLYFKGCDQRMEAFKIMLINQVNKFVTVMLTKMWFARWRSMYGILFEI